MLKCLVCQGGVIPFITFGKMPIANGFLTSKEFKNEYFFNLEAGFCKNCSLVQLTEIVDPPKLFHEHYSFYSSTSEGMRTHFQQFATQMKNKYLKKVNSPFVIEIGSNDGIMLKNFLDWKIKHLGIEPSKNVARVAKTKGIKTISEFFDIKLAKKIIKKYGNADVILGANVICHIPNLNSLVEGVSLLLKPKGVFIFEEPYIGEILKKTSYDQIYDEHVFYFSASSVQNAIKKFDLELINVEPQEVHGGELRYTIARSGEYHVNQSVKKTLAQEKRLGLLTIAVYKDFAKKLEKTKSDLMSLLNKLKKQKKRVVGYAATSKSTTIINYFGITPDHLEFISDTTLIKQGKFSPGQHIPILPYEQFKKNYPEYALLFAWNHSQEIMANEKDFVKSKGKWILYVPKVRII